MRLIMVVCIFSQLDSELGQKAKKLDCGLLVHPGLGFVRWGKWKRWMERNQEYWRQNCPTDSPCMRAWLGKEGRKRGLEEAAGLRVKGYTQGWTPVWGQGEGTLGVKVWKHSKDWGMCSGMWSEGCGGQFSCSFSIWAFGWRSTLLCPLALADSKLESYLR